MNNKVLHLVTNSRRDLIFLDLQVRRMDGLLEELWLTCSVFTQQVCDFKTSVLVRANLRKQENVQPANTAAFPLIPLQRFLMQLKQQVNHTADRACLRSRRSKPSVQSLVQTSAWAGYNVDYDRAFVCLFLPCWQDVDKLDELNGS